MADRRPGGQLKGNRKRIPVNLRMSPGLHETLLAMAEKHGRSITQQAETLLEWGLLAKTGDLLDLVREVVALVRDMQRMVALLADLDEAREYERPRPAKNGGDS